MSHRNDKVDLSSESEEKISYALSMIKNTEERTKSIVFQDNVGVLNFGGISRARISLPANSSFRIISTTDLDKFDLEIETLKVNQIVFYFKIYIF